MNDMPMIHVELSHMKQHMVAAFHTHVDEIKKEIDHQLETVVSAEGFKAEISKAIKQQLSSALREYVGQLIRKALTKHEDFLKAAVMEHVAQLMSEDQVKQLMQE